MAAGAVAEYVDAVARRLEANVGQRLAGAWIVGSGALGDFDRVRSDVDIQAVVDVRLSRAELERLAASLSHPALFCPIRGLEFVLYAREDLTDPRGPAFQLNLNTGPGMEFHAGYEPTAEPRFWFVLDVAIARQRARPLVGPPPVELLPVLPRPLVLSALRDALAWYRGWDGGEAVLAACRSWAWAVDGQWLSKGEAAAWAIGRLPDPAPVAKALARRGEPAAPGPDPAQVAAVLAHVEPVLAGP
jgi:hypothetical protein